MHIMDVQPPRWLPSSTTAFRQGMDMEQLDQLVQQAAADFVGGRGGTHRHIRADRVHGRHEGRRRRARLHAASVRAVARVILLVASAFAVRAAVVGAAGTRRCIRGLERVREDPLLAAAERHPRREGEDEQSVQRA